MERVTRLESSQCKKQLAEARQRLKDLTEELKVAEKKQTETQEALDKAMERVTRLESGHEAAAKHANQERDEYLEAKASYEKQLAVIARMEADIKVAAEEVKKMRDAEDGGGGVYNTRSAAAQNILTPIVGLALAMSLSLW